MHGFFRGFFGLLIASLLLFSPVARGEQGVADEGGTARELEASVRYDESRPEPTLKK